MHSQGASIQFYVLAGKLIDIFMPTVMNPGYHATVVLTAAMQMGRAAQTAQKFSFH